MDDGLKVKYKKVLTTLDEQEALSFETKLIQEIGLDKLCNLTTGSEGHTKSHSEETRRKISQTMKGRLVSKETGRKIGLAKKGQKYKPFSIETRRKMSIAHTGKIVSTETRHKLSIANTGEKNPMYGKTHSEETKQKISMSLKRK